MSNPLVSIIVPVYKVPEQFLRKCIESCINQTIRETEIILVDDGSPDDCGAICDEYATKDERIKVIHQSNKGLSGARNSGCKMAIGEYITFVDGDDWIEQETCEQAYRQAVKSNAEIVCWGTVKDYIRQSTRYVYANTFVDGKIYIGEECKYMQEMLLHYNGYIATAYSKLIKRSYIENNNIYHDEVLRQGAEGLEYCLRLFETADRILFLNKHWYHYIFNENSISAAPTEQNNFIIIKCFEKIEKIVNESKNKSRLKPWLYNRFLYVIVTTAISGYFHPKNKGKYKAKKKAFKNYLSNPFVSTALKTKNRLELSFSRKVVLMLIKLKQFWLIALLAKIRYNQK